jgi:hypothetical protein
VSTFRLLARTFPNTASCKNRSSCRCLHNAGNNACITLTTGTFNLLSKTDSHFRLSGAPSVRPDSTEGICPSSKLVKPIALRARCQPADITGFPPDFNSQARTSTQY